jgi:D-hexose-6-phosphate mutarotase
MMGTSVVEARILTDADPRHAAQSHQLRIGDAMRGGTSLSAPAFGIHSQARHPLHRPRWVLLQMTATDALPFENALLRE